MHSIDRQHPFDGNSALPRTHAIPWDAAPNAKRRALGYKERPLLNLPFSSIILDVLHLRLREFEHIWRCLVSSIWGSKIEPYVEAVEAVNILKRLRVKKHSVGLFDTSESVTVRSLDGRDIGQVLDNLDTFFECQRAVIDVVHVDQAHTDMTAKLAKFKPAFEGLREVLRLCEGDQFDDADIERLRDAITTYLSAKMDPMVEGVNAARNYTHMLLHFPDQAAALWDMKILHRVDVDGDDSQLETERELRTSSQAHSQQTPAHETRLIPAFFGQGIIEAHHLWSRKRYEKACRRSMHERMSNVVDQQGRLLQGRIMGFSESPKRVRRPTKPDRKKIRARSLLEINDACRSTYENAQDARKRRRLHDSGEDEPDHGLSSDSEDDDARSDISSGSDVRSDCSDIDYQLQENENVHSDQGARR